MDSVTICNLALMMVGIPAITSFDDNNNNAKLCESYFPVLRDRCLRDHLWSFATVSCHLQQLKEESLDDRYPVVCALPSDLIRIVGLSDDSPYRKASDRILVRSTNAKLIYIRRVLDPNLFDETFIEALQYLIASEIGLANTRDTSLINLFRQKYEMSLATARSIDSFENRFSLQPNEKRSSWIAARNGTADRISCGVEFVEGTEGKQV